jgi:hypothetical protein
MPIEDLPPRGLSIVELRELQGFRTHGANSLGVIELPRWNGRPSLVMCARGPRGAGVVVHAVGQVRELLEDGDSDLDAVGLDDAPPGLTVWEGRIKSGRAHLDGPDTALVGTYRAPTAEEVVSLIQGMCPWDLSLWMTREYQEQVLMLDSATPAPEGHPVWSLQPDELAVALGVARAGCP